MLKSYSFRAESTRHRWRFPLPWKMGKAPGTGSWAGAGTNRDNSPKNGHGGKISGKERKAMNMDEEEHCPDRWEGAGLWSLSVQDTAGSGDPEHRGDTSANNKTFPCLPENWSNHLHAAPERSLTELKYIHRYFPFLHQVWNQNYAMREELTSFGRQRLQRIEQLKTDHKAALNSLNSKRTHRKQ